jgi:hypothetical protein
MGLGMKNPKTQGRKGHLLGVWPLQPLEYNTTIADNTKTLQKITISL